MSPAMLCLWALACSKPAGPADPGPTTSSPLADSDGPVDSTPGPTNDSPTTDTRSGDGWLLEDGRCIVTADPPVAEERHLGEALPPPDGAATCTAAEDCDESEFCGDGHCRPLGAEMVTLCLEEVWYEGPADYPPGGQATLSQPNNTYDGEPTIWLEPPWQRGCRVTPRHCERFFPGVLQMSYFSWFSVYEGGDEQCSLEDEATTLWFPLGHVSIAPLVDQGAVGLPAGPEGTTVWVSVWYP